MRYLYFLQEKKSVSGYEIQSTLKWGLGQLPPCLGWPRVAIKGGLSMRRNANKIEGEALAKFATLLS